MEQTKISIIIPVYNTEMYLDACLKSAIKQTIKEIEIICIDDKSTDSSLDLLINFSYSDKRLKLLKHDRNKGVGAARNTGLENASGKYIFFLDSDDTIPQDALSLLYLEAQKYDNDLVKGGHENIYIDGKVEYQSWSSPERKTINTNLYQSNFLQKIPTGYWTYLYKREFLNENNIIFRSDLIVGEDLVFLTAALTKAKTVTLISNVVYHYHQSNSSVTRGIPSKKIINDAINTKRIIVDMLNDIELNEAAIAQLKNWDYIISTQWTRMYNSLTHDEYNEIFSNYRALVSSNHIIPWSERTPHHHRYILALLISKRDIEALSFLSTEASSKGFSKQEELIEALNYILTVAPHDISCLTELGYIAYRNGEFDHALDFFDEIIRYDNKNYKAHLQSTIILKHLRRINEANSRLDTILKSITIDSQYHDTVLSVTLLKDDIIRTEETAKLNEVVSKTNNLRIKLDTVNKELNLLYASKSWEITKPIRKIISYIKH